MHFSYLLNAGVQVTEVTDVSPNCTRLHFEGGGQAYLSVRTTLDALKTMLKASKEAAQ